ncbi:MAG: ComF family protein [Hydrogenovibrio sp.]|uniref:ComF family protein n=1 Tax=Hydrogenovibrio sp. TaxID=2065821 RepID=UPI0028702DF5|nr:ComF family protein [Hydrogenovibrio sp.]MDR9498906.1 ComF family protein [Hydrogenovibrio sp.]
MPKAHKPSTGHWTPLTPEKNGLSSLASRLRGVSEWVFPPTCARQGVLTDAVDLSAEEVAALSVPGDEGESLCPQCLAPMPAEVGRICGRCLQTSPPFEQTLAAFRYEGTAKAFVQALKYGPDLSYGQVMAQLWRRRLTEMAAQAEACTAGPIYLIPVPLHPQRLRQRGFNQSLELAKLLCQIGSDSPFVWCRDWVRRRHDTPSQAGLSAKARQTNLKRAFALTAAGERQLAGLEGGTVVLLDDVMTTGSTLFHLGRVCRRANADIPLQSWVFARANPP